MGMMMIWMNTKNFMISVKHGTLLKVTKMVITLLLQMERKLDTVIWQYIINKITAELIEILKLPKLCLTNTKLLAGKLKSQKKNVLPNAVNKGNISLSRCKLVSRVTDCKNSSASKFSTRFFNYNKIGK